MGSFLFWLLLPYLIASFVAIARRSEFSEHRSAMDLGRDVTKIAREVLKPARGAS